MSSPSEETQDSATPVTVKYLLALGGNLEVTSLKCSSKECDGKVTPHQWTKVGPTAMPGTEVNHDMMELMKKFRRLKMCQGCGTVSVTT